MKHSILAITRTRCWNRNGCLFPSEEHTLMRVNMTHNKTFELRYLLKSVKLVCPEPEEGFEDLHFAAAQAPRIITYWDKDNNKIAPQRSKNKKTLSQAFINRIHSVVVDYGKDDGIASPFLVETYTFHETEINL